MLLQDTPTPQTMEASLYVTTPCLELNTVQQNFAGGTTQTDSCLNEKLRCANPCLHVGYETDNAGLFKALWSKLMIYLDVPALLLQCQHPKLLLLSLNQLGLLGIQFSHVDLQALLQLQPSATTAPLHHRHKK
jgi:hypothetical protein